MIKWLNKTLLKKGTISEPDLDIFQVVDKPEEVIEIITKTVVV